MPGSLTASSTAALPPWSLRVAGSPLTAVLLTVLSGVVFGYLAMKLVTATWLLGSAVIKGSGSDVAFEAALVACVAVVFASAVQLKVQLQAAGVKFRSTCCADIGCALGGMPFALVEPSWPDPFVNALMQAFK
jgi:hypothetical protein